MKKWYNVELSKETAECFRRHLLNEGIKFETSGCYNLIHFEVYCTAEEVETLNNFLDQL